MKKVRRRRSRSVSGDSQSSIQEVNLAEFHELNISQAGDLSGGSNLSYKNDYWSRIVSLRTFTPGTNQRWPIGPDLDIEKLIFADIEDNDE